MALILPMNCKVRIINVNLEFFPLDMIHDLTMCKRNNIVGNNYSLSVSMSWCYRVLYFLWDHSR